MGHPIYLVVGTGFGPRSLSLFGKDEVYMMPAVGLYAGIMLIALSSHFAQNDAGIKFTSLHQKYMYIYIYSHC